jgi:RNA polymerase sigma-70 factor (sigma-E family)
VSIATKEDWVADGSVERALVGVAPIVREDREVAFRALFAQERTAMVRLAAVLLGSPARAEEVVQDAFAVVYERWDRVDKPGAFLRACVVNGCRHVQRRRALEIRRALPPDPGSIDGEARELLDALAALPLRQRAVVVLRFYEGMTQEEIADALGLPVGTVKSSLHRALARLREVIER